MYSARVTSQKILNRFIFYAQRGYKKRSEHWAVLRRKKTPAMKALEHFDDFYGKVFGRRWPSIRIALLSPHKYCAVVNNYADSKETITSLENAGAVNLKSFFDVAEERLKANEGDNMTEDVEEFQLKNTLKEFAISKEEEEFHCGSPSAERESKLNEGNGKPSEENRILTFREVTEQQIQSLASTRLKADLDKQRVIKPSHRPSSTALHEYVPATKLKGMDDWFADSQHYGYYEERENFPVKVRKEHDLSVPTYLNAFVFERGNVTRFKSPKQGSTGVLNYFLMDGSSLLPVLALNLKPGDSVLDMCAAPGGKSLAILQTLLPSFLVCNDNTRVKRIQNVLHQYLYDLEKWDDRIKITQEDGRHLTNDYGVNKILVDVPCTTDRHSLCENVSNNIFNPARTKERLRLPELQTELLVNAMKTVSPGGTVVYSTCTLSPIQNDGVVHMALRKIWQETMIDMEVRDLAPALEKTKLVFMFAEHIGLRYGHLVIPFLPCNFGPMYFCKFVRVK